MARTITSQIGTGICGNCAECGALVSSELTWTDVELADELDEYQKPLGFYRDCPECGHEDASILRR